MSKISMRGMWPRFGKHGWDRGPVFLGTELNRVNISVHVLDLYHFKGPVCKIEQHLMVRKYIADSVVLLVVTSFINQNHIHLGCEFSL